MTKPKLTKQEQKDHLAMLRSCLELHSEIRQAHLKGLIIPREWSEIAAIPPMPGKDRITLRVDKDVVKWFRNLGPGYQRRINTVLRVFMLSTLSKEFEGEFAHDWKGDPITSDLTDGHDLSKFPGA